MVIKMIIGLLSFIGNIIALVGWFAAHSLGVLIVGSILHYLEIVLTFKELNTGAKVNEILAFVIGGIVASFLHVSFFVGGLIGANIFGFLIGLMSVGIYIDYIKSLFRKKKP